MNWPRTSARSSSADRSGRDGRVSPSGWAVWGGGTELSAALVAAAVVVSVAAMLGGSFGWRWYHESRLSRIDFKAETPLSVEILEPNSDSRPVDPFTAPTEMPVALAEGSYRARVSAPGMLGQTYSLQVDRGQTESYTLRLDDRNLWDAPAKRMYDLVRPLARDRGPDRPGRVRPGVTPPARRQDGAPGLGEPDARRCLFPSPGNHSIQPPT